MLLAVSDNFVRTFIFGKGIAGNCHNKVSIFYSRHRRKQWGGGIKENNFALDSATKVKK